MKLNHIISLNDTEKYTGATYIDICQTSIIAETSATLLNPENPTIVPGTGIESPKTNLKMTNLKNNNIEEAIHQKLWNKDVYETNMHNIYNVIVGQTNEYLQERAA